jgi:hypothetical protein
LDYFAAVTEGRKRVNRAVGALQEVAGPCYPMLFLKLGIPDWTPVGEEMLHQVIPGKEERAALVVCDAEGNSKAMSAWVSEEDAQKFSKELELRGISVFPGEVKLPI